MEALRKPYQGILNILRFNWHFYLLSVFGISFSFLLLHVWLQLTLIAWLFIFLILFSITVSLLVSYFVYDKSGLYDLKWLNLSELVNGTILNIHAGFDETSALLKGKFPFAQLLVYDFYNPRKHTEISIKRARKAYPAFPGSIAISTSHIPLDSGSADFVLLIFAAHEIREDEEKIIFFKEINRVLKQDGSVVLVEHLQDLPNFLAYNLGFLHFTRLSTWKKTFEKAGFYLLKDNNLNPFIKQFILIKNGTAH